VIDSLGCALGAWKEERARLRETVASDIFAKEGSTIIARITRRRRLGSFANGCCIRYFDYNDTYLSKGRRILVTTFRRRWLMAESVGATDAN